MSAFEFAAGTVPYREVTTETGEQEIMVLLVHRTKWKDISFPKGKLDRGETVPQAAVRETHEETGLFVHLGVNLGTIDYALKNGKEKVVQYWAAEVSDEAALQSTFTPNKEIEALEWIALDRADERLSYPRDREILEVFRSLVNKQLLPTFSITVLRHCQAVGKGQGEDAKRRLTDRGYEQAEMLIAPLTAFGPKRVYSSDAERCLLTVTPLADELDVEVREKHGLSQEAFNDGDLDGLRRVVGKTVRKKRNAVLCSHRPVLPEIARELALATGSIPGSYLQDAVELPPGGFAVFHLSAQRPGAGIVAVESYPLKLRP
jgi:phosphohistidine phosphatase SixA/8-oxo-dGTP pyrophosphatase MutT (NUDIX family)